MTARAWLWNKRGPIASQYGDLFLDQVKKAVVALSK
ncbi:hypothetical protein C5167_031439 [Papaver somniferum]|uniref:Uncharacterized protein n=1 Tax=Papaver somniferum TaxID=3469 RepID=A0A4Y7K766_PAPSO|nr:hypothetical protein C5167_031439 [Papaver somniferum]